MAPADRRSRGKKKSDRTGPDRLGPKRFGSVRTGSVGPGRFGPVRFGRGVFEWCGLGRSRALWIGAERTGPVRTGSVRRKGPRRNDSWGRVRNGRGGEPRAVVRERRARERHEGGDFDGEDLGRAGEGGDEPGGALLHEEILATEKEASCGEWVGAGLGAHEALEEGAQAGVGPESTGQPL